MISSAFRRLLVIAFVTALVAVPVAHAQSTRTWNGLAPDSQWTNPDNWDTGVPISGDTALFNDVGAINGSPILGNSSQPIKTILFDSITNAAYTLGDPFTNDTFNFDAGGAITVNSTVAPTQTINAAIQAAGLITIKNSSTTGLLTLVGNIGGASGSITYGGATNGVIQILGQNSYASNTTINVNGNTLQIGSSSNSPFTSGPFGIGTILTNSGTNSPMQAINADQTIANPFTLTFGFTVSNAATPFNMSFTGPFTYLSASTRTLTINTPGKTVTFGSAATPSTITLSNTASTALLIDPSQNSLLVINDVMQDNGAIAGSINYNSIGNNTPMGTIQINGANTYSGVTSLNGQTSGTPVVGLTVQIGVDTVGSPGSITSGPFGKGTVTTNGNSNGPPILQAFGADRTVANAITMTSGFFVTGSHSLTLTGPVTLGSTGRTITNNLASGLAVTFGSAGSPSTITLGNTLGIQTQTSGGGMTIINDAIGGTGGLTVQNGATVVLNSATNAYGGTTTLQGATTGGKLLVNGSKTGSGVVNVSSLSILGGGGSVAGTITNNGTIAPGAVDGTPGTLTATGNVTDAAGSHWAIELNGTAADKLAVGGNLDLNASDTLDVTGIGTGTSWVIASYTGTLSGTFDTLNIPSGYTVDYGTLANSQITLEAPSVCARRS